MAKVNGSDLPDTTAAGEDRIAKKAAEQLADEAAHTDRLALQNQLDGGADEARELIFDLALTQAQIDRLADKPVADVGQGTGMQTGEAERAGACPDCGWKGGAHGGNCGRLQNLPAMDLGPEDPRLAEAARALEQAEKFIVDKEREIAELRWRKGLPGKAQVLIQLDLLTQDFTVKYPECKTYDMILGILHMAEESIRTEKRDVEARQRMAAVEEQMKNAAVANAMLKNPRRTRK